jgi:outer membrane protein TolC
MRKPATRKGRAPVRTARVLALLLSGGALPFLAEAKGQPAAQDKGAMPADETRGPPPARLLPPSETSAPPSGKAEELSVAALVGQVLARNPTLAQMTAAWRAAQARYPQVTSLDDPMLAATGGPCTIRPDDPGVEFAYRLEISQKYPWPGKLRLRGDNALAEARAAGNEVEDTRLQLVEAAKDGFYEYYLVYRGLDVNEENLRLLREFQQNAETRYRTGLVPQQDVLQAKVEIGRQQERQFLLERMRKVARARLNTLLDLPPDAPLPPPPRHVTLPDGLPDVQALRAAALARRPDLQATANRVQAEEAALALACKEYYPDFEPFLMYDRFMGNVSDNRDLAWMLGVRMNLPVRLERRRGAVAEARAKVAQRRAELARQVDQAAFQVQQAYDQAVESRRVVRLYDKDVLPAARANVKSAQSAYMTGKIPFLSLVEAERDVVRLQDRYYEAVADYFRRLAALERAVGGPVTPAPPAPDAGQAGGAHDGVSSSSPCAPNTPPLALPPPGMLRSGPVPP